jgi:O-antigen/teichoic acid export membrane protein
MADTRTDLQRAVGASMAGKAAELVTLVLLATVVPRALGPDEYGRFAVPLTIVTLGTLALSLGGPTVLARFVPLAPEGRRVATARAIGARLAVGRAWQLAATGVAAAVASLAVTDSFPPSTSAAVVISLALSVSATIAVAVPMGLGRPGPWVTRWPLQNAVLIAAVLVVGPYAAIALSCAAAAAYGLWAVLPVWRSPEPSVVVPEGAMRFGSQQAAGAAMSQVAQRGGVIAVAVLGASTAETGYAALALGIAAGATAAILQAFTVSLPHLAGPDREDGGELALRRLVRLLLAVVFPLAAVGALVVGDIVPVVFGDEFEGAVDAFGPALGLVVLAPLASGLVQVASLRMRPQVVLTSGAAALAAFVVVAAVAVPAWGAAGATAAALAGVAAGVATSLALLAGSADTWVALLSFAGAAGVALLAAVA